MKVQILGHEEIKQGEKYNTYRITYHVNGKDFKATQWGKEPLQPGEMDCDITEETNTDGSKFAKIKKVSTGGSGGRGYQPKTKEQLDIEARAQYPSFAVSYAKDCFVAGKIERKELSDLSNELFNMMVILGGGKNAQPMAKEPLPAETLLTDESGDLPF